MSREIDEEEQAELREFFAGCDLDRDGRIQKAEFAELLKNLGSEISAEEVTIGFNEVDRDGSGSIDFEEFLGYWLEH